MSATERITDLDTELLDVLAPPDVPSDDEIADYWTEPATSPKPTFAVDDVGAADWAARKILQHQAAIDEVQAWRDRLVAQADAALAREHERHRPSIEFFEWHLTRWLRDEIDADTSKKPRASRDLPSGVTVKRTSPGRSLVIDDHDALVDWLTAKEDTHRLVEPQWKVDRAGVKNLILKDGLAVPGVHIERGEFSYRVVLP